MKFYMAGSKCYSIWTPTPITYETFSNDEVSLVKYLNGLFVSESSMEQTVRFYFQMTIKTKYNNNND